MATKENQARGQASKQNNEAQSVDESSHQEKNVSFANDRNI